MKMILVACISLIGLAAAAAPNASVETTVATSPGPRWELRTAPLAFLAQWTTIDVGYRIGSRISTGPAFVSYGAKTGNMFLPSLEGQALGWYANYYFGSVNRSGGYSSLHLYQEDYLAHPHPERDGERFKHVGQRLNAIIGYRWTRANFDILLGGGAMAIDHQVDETKYVSTSITDPGHLETSSKRVSAAIPIVELKAGVQF